jgi:MinD-like ATPase involved in chromosome partitioning or flagellar assembly
MTTTAALVGATGGAGATRLTVEFAAALARDGRDVAVLDAAFATQGLAQYLQGRIDPDVTALATEERALAEGLVELPVHAAGRVVCCPAYAPFERLARAKAPEAARRIESFVRDAAVGYDHVLVDVPPVAANQAVAAVNATDLTVVVTPGTIRGRDALPRQRDRLLDVGAAAPRVVVNRADGEDPAADATVPESAVTSPGEAPVADDGDGAFAEAVVRAVETTLEADLDVTFETGILS